MVAPSRGADRPRTLRRLNVPRDVQVRVDAAGAPSALRRGGDWLQIIERLDRYRTDDRWWSDQPIARTYHELLLEDGRSVTIFHNDLRNEWHEQRYG
jgi:hypothetical protein